MMCTIRPGRDADVPAVLALRADAGAEPTHTDTAESLDRLIRHDPSAVMVAEDGHELVGSVVACWDGWRGSIYRLVVAPSHRRRGLGRLLLEAAEARLAGIGAVRLQAIVVEQDAATTSFWRATSWQQQDGRLRFVKG